MSSIPPDTIIVEPHPGLRISAFGTTFPAPLGDLPPDPAAVGQLMTPAREVEGAPALRSAVRDMLRQGGYKPSGRGKPASEYLLRASGDGALAPINAAVDACNAISLHSGFPISVVDLDLAIPPFRIGIPPAGSTYVFNASGQEITLTGLLCLFDAEGPCGNAVRDSQRTKTRPETVQTLSVVWGVEGYEEALGSAVADYRSLLEGIGARTELVEAVTP